MGSRGQWGSNEHDLFWDQTGYRPLAWCSHWMELPEPPPKPWARPGKPITAPAASLAC